jgi:hypothetical protein
MEAVKDRDDTGQYGGESRYGEKTARKYRDLGKEPDPVRI